MGQGVNLTTDTYPHLMRAEFTPKNLQSEKEAVKLVYRVKIDIPKVHMGFKAGVPAGAQIMVAMAQ